MAALRWLKEFAEADKLVLVLGDMLELERSITKSAPEGFTHRL